MKGKNRDLYVTQATAACILGVTRQRVQQLLATGELRYRTRVSGRNYPVLHREPRLSSVLERAKAQGKLDEAMQRLMQMTEGSPSLHTALKKYLISGGFYNDKKSSERTEERGHWNLSR